MAVAGRQFKERFEAVGPRDFELERELFAECRVGRAFTAVRAAVVEQRLGHREASDRVDQAVLNGQAIFRFLVVFRCHRCTGFIDFLNTERVWVAVDVGLFQICPGCTRLAACKHLQAGPGDFLRVAARNGAIQLEPDRRMIVEVVSPQLVGRHIGLGDDIRVGERQR